MFWSDPNLYGATMYKDVPTPVQPPWLAHWNIPKFIPPTFGINPPYFNVPPTAFNPFIRQDVLGGFVRPDVLSQFVRPETINPYMSFNPYLQTVNPYLQTVNPYMQTYGFTRPFC